MENRATPSFSLGEHPVLEAIQRRLADGEKLLAYLDDVTVICRPERVRTVTTTIDEKLARHAHVNIHYGKTQVWNRGGVAPEGIDELTRLARLVKPEAVVWRGDTQLPVERQGVRLLGVPIGSPILCANSWRTNQRSKICCFIAFP